MIRSALRSLFEDVVSVAKWAAGELVSELDYRLQPVHVRQGWAAAETLNDIEAGIDSHEPNAPYLQWGGPETWPQPEGQIEVRVESGHRSVRATELFALCDAFGVDVETFRTSEVRKAAAMARLSAATDAANAAEARRMAVVAELRSIQAEGEK